MCVVEHTISCTVSASGYMQCSNWRLRNNNRNCFLLQKFILRKRRIRYQTAGKSNLQETKQFQGTSYNQPFGGKGISVQCKQLPLGTNLISLTTHIVISVSPGLTRQLFVGEKPKLEATNQMFVQICLHVNLPSHQGRLFRQLDLWICPGDPNKQNPSLLVVTHGLSVIGHCAKGHSSLAREVNVLEGQKEARTHKRNAKWGSITILDDNSMWKMPLKYQERALPLLSLPFHINAHEVNWNVLWHTITRMSRGKALQTRLTRGVRLIAQEVLPALCHYAHLRRINNQGQAHQHFAQLNTQIKWLHAHWKRSEWSPD